MPEFWGHLSVFHFLRPYWLLAIPPMAWIWWKVRFRVAAERGEENLIASHLLKALTPEVVPHNRFTAIDSVLIAFFFVTIGTAGPTWSLKQNPFKPPTPPAVVIVEISPSMHTRDVQPSRLARAKLKIRDFAELRSGAATALLAFDGSAHVVLPLTEDPSLFIPFLEGLEPEVMPEPGQRIGTALELADQLLLGEHGFGGIVVFADGINPADSELVRSMSKRSDRILLALPLGGKESASFRDFETVSMTPDGKDMKKLERRLALAYQSADIDAESDAWDDKGWLFIWPAVVITLLWFRKGWTMRWAARTAMLLLLCSIPADAFAETWIDLIATTDQQGRYAFEQKDFASAAELFVAPAWKGVALYRLGKYEEAAGAFAEHESAQAYFNQGNALVKSAAYQQAIEAYENALKINPEYPSAQHNLQLAKVIYAQVTRARKESGLGEQDEITADEIKFDKQAKAAKEVKLGGSDKRKLLSAEKWMRTVDTKVKDYLALKFAEDNARREK